MANMDIMPFPPICVGARAYMAKEYITDVGHVVKSILVTLVIAIFGLRISVHLCISLS